MTTVHVAIILAIASGVVMGGVMKPRFKGATILSNIALFVIIVMAMYIGAATRMGPWIRDNMPASSVTDIIPA